jgi:hypothetical protein
VPQQTKHLQLKILKFTLQRLATHSGACLTSSRPCASPTATASLSSSLRGATQMAPAPALSQAWIRPLHTLLGHFFLICFTLGTRFTPGVQKKMSSILSISTFLLVQKQYSMYLTEVLYNFFIKLLTFSKSVCQLLFSRIQVFVLINNTSFFLSLYCLLCITLIT